MTEWINIKDKIPDKDGRYIVSEYNNNYLWIGISSLRNGKFDGGESVTHCMHLPEIPK